MTQGKKNKLLLVIIVMVAVSAGAVAGLPVFKGRLALKAPEIPVVKGDPVPEADLKILKELGSLFHRLDSVADFEIKGSVSANDPADSPAVATAFHYACLDSMVYYRLGEEEILSTREAFVIADHAAEKLFVSAPRSFNPGVFVASDQMANFLTGEGYAISRKKRGALNWITLSRTNHITCKEYRVGFDDDGLIRETFMRLTDPRDPLNTEKDRIVQTRADEWKLDRPARSLFNISRFVRRQSGTYVAAGPFTLYQLILTQ
jgi:hypothetical protein